MEASVTIVEGTAPRVAEVERRDAEEPWACVMLEEAIGKVSITIEDEQNNENTTVEATANNFHDSI